MSSFTSFFPGPSQVHPDVPRYFAEGFEQGIGAISHRSAKFNDLSEKCLIALHEKLNIPNDYKILYTTSATQSWEIIPQCLTEKAGLHYYSGSFGEKWFEYAQFIKPLSVGHQIEPSTLINSDLVQVEKETDVICLTQNETSNGTQIPYTTILELRKKYPNTLIAYDLTSSIAGIKLPFEAMDIAFASVQKCFGLPAGLGLLVLSPKAVEKARHLNVKGYFDSVLGLLEKIELFQTNHTPNVMAIYALMRRMSDAPNIDEVNETTLQRLKDYNKLIEELDWCSPFVENEEIRSKTVLTLKTEPEILPRLYKEAESEGILLGKGYGNIKNTTFRIANFPAHSPEQIEHLMQFLRNFKA